MVRVARHGWRRGVCRCLCYGADLACLRCVFMGYGGTREATKQAHPASSLPLSRRDVVHQGPFPLRRAVPPTLYRGPGSPNTSDPGIGFVPYSPLGRGFLTGKMALLNG